MKCTKAYTDYRRALRVALVLGALALALAYLADRRLDQRLSSRWIVVSGQSSAPTLLVVEEPPDPSRVPNGGRVLKVAAESYSFGVRFPWFTTVSYLVWDESSPADASPLPRAELIERAVGGEYMSLCVRTEPKMSRIKPERGHAMPDTGQRLLQGFNLLGSSAEIFVALFAASVAVLGACGLHLLRERAAESAAARAIRRRGQSVLDRACPDCGYEVDHTVQTRCPECGCDLREVLRLSGEAQK